MDIVPRIKGLLTNPKVEWQTIAAEEPRTCELLGSYVLPLVLVPTIATFLGWGFVGGGPGSSLSWALALAIVAFLSGFVSVYVTAVVADVLAPQFASQSNRGRALQLIAYSCTPAWVLGIFDIIPGLAWLTMVGGIWSLYLLYLGMPSIMKTPQEKIVPYLIVMIIVVIAVYVVVAAVLTRLLLPLFGFHPGLFWGTGV